MSTERRGTEIFVGLFLLAGFAVIATMAMVFGGVGQNANDFYRITVQFPNAAGLVKGSDVLLSGATIGYVAEPPSLVATTFQVAVKLNIAKAISIPRRSSFVVNSSGLLGDRFVEVLPLPGFDAADKVGPGETIPGSRAGGLDELTAKGGVVMDQLTAELAEIRLLTARLREEMLSEGNMKNLQETFANLRTTTERFKETSAGLDAVIAKTGGTIDSTKATMDTANAAAGDLRAAIADLRKTADATTKTVESVRALVSKAGASGGALGTLINDEKLADDLKALAANLRRSGVLFYKDKPAAAPTPAKRR